MSLPPAKRAALRRFPVRLKAAAPFRFAIRHGMARLHTIHLVHTHAGPPWTPLCGDRALTVPRRHLWRDRPPGLPCVACAVSLNDHYPGENP